MITSSVDLTERVFLEYKPKIYMYITRKGVPYSDREDVFSEVLLKLLHQAERYDSAKASAPTWVYVITRSVVADYFKKRKKAHSLTELHLSDFGFEGRVELEMELSRLARQIARLPEKEKRVVLLRSYNGMEYREIAKAMNISEVNARQIYSRSLKKLRDWMASE
jgi:RNA polymerase sigma-70 factor (ECF subfamily)